MRPSLFIAVFVLSACASNRTPDPVPALPAEDPVASSTQARDFGVLVMAHGGDPEWNRTVADAVAPLAREVPTRVAFGMASPRTLEAALDSLRRDGVDHVSVVRMFLSGRSFLEQTEYLLGLSPEPPASFILMDHGAGGYSPPEGGGHGVHGAHAPETPAPIAHGLTLATHGYGMLESREATEIMRARALALSDGPSQESVLLLAHGMGDEAENNEVLAVMDAIAGSVRREGFASVQTATLREDWEEERVEAEREIRAWVASESAAGRRVLVLPMRLSGFGPYAEVLQGLDYVPGEGLLPHPAISDWLRHAATQVACSHGWRTPLSNCASLADDRTGSLR